MSIKLRNNYGLLFKIFLSLFAIWFLLHSKLLTPGLITNLFKQPYVFIAVIFLMIVTLILSSWRWYRLNLALGIEVSLTNTIYLTYIGLAFNNVLPGGISGDVIRLTEAVNKSNSSKSSVMLSLMVDRLMGLMGVAILMTMIVALKIQLNTTDLHYFVVVSFAFMLAGVTILFVLPKEIGITAWFKRRFGGARWSNFLITILESIQAYRNNRVIILDAMMTSVLIQIVIALILYTIANQSIHLSVSLVDSTVASMTTQIANWLPLTPGGLGVGEIVFAKTLAILNQKIIFSSATIYLIYRLMNLVFSLPAVFVYLLRNSLPYSRTEEA